jgi:endonuclease/exonuclease/phosphatase family metal-dependent hydrolase
VPRTREDYARLREYAALLDADVVALQEVDGAEAAGRVFDPAVYSFHLSADEGYLQRTGFAYRKTLEVSPNRDLVGLSIGGTRRGADLTVKLSGGSLRLLSVHLKSGCWSGPLTAATPACGILRAELPVLEAWIDARAREAIPFAVLGDFNRRFGQTDAFWLAIDDGDPPGADLTDAAAGRRSQCWGGEFPGFIDHLVFSRGAALLLVPGSFEQLMFRPADRAHRATLSDHCPIAVTLMAEEPAGLPAPARAADGAPPTLTAAEAAAHLDEVARVCGVVASARYAGSARGRPTFLNLDSPYPDPIFTVFIRGTNRPAFGRPEVRYAGKRICVTGRITLYKDTPEIEARRPSQIALAGDPKK